MDTATVASTPGEGKGLLEKVQLFAGLSAEEIEAIETHAVLRTFRKNTVFIHKGEESSRLYLIVSGKVKVFVSDEYGREKVLSMQGPGDHLGELSLLADSSRTASAMTLEDSSFLVLSKTAFLECLGRNPRIALNLIRILVERVSRLTEEVSGLALGDVYSRLVRLLQEQGREEGAELITGRLTQQEMGSMVGASREMVSMLLRDLRAGGYIAVKNKRISILKKLPTHW